MKKKKVYRLKTLPKIILCLLVIAVVAGIYFNKRYQEYLYTQTFEYKLLEVGYSNTDTNNLVDNLNNKELEKVLTYDYNEFLPHFVTAKYFIFDNLDKYLSQVITKEQDFFKYRGPDDYDYDKIVSEVNVNIIYDFYTNTKSTDRSKNYALLVNKYYELGSDYEPDDLVSIPWKYRLGLENESILIRSEVLDAYLEMWQAAYDEEGIYLLALSGYRSYASQLQVYKLYEDSKGTKYADSIAARPGYSEHQTGLSLDIYSKECQRQSTFKDSKTYAWLVKNAHKYGFILRYPKDKESITGYNYESWHYRYVGKELASKVYESGLTYDEYYIYGIENDLLK